MSIHIISFHFCEGNGRATRRRAEEGSTITRRKRTQRGRERTTAQKEWEGIFPLLVVGVAVLPLLWLVMLSPFLLFGWSRCSSLPLRVVLFILLSLVGWCCLLLLGCGAFSDSPYGWLNFSICFVVFCFCVKH